MDREPRVAERIHEVVRDRLGRDIVTPQGDLVNEELEEAEGVDYGANDRERP
jgi:voltage-gated potassium channel